MQRGWAWLREGVAIWRRNPALVTFATFGYLLSIVLLSIVPILGQLVASLLMPALSVGVLNACRAVDAGRKAGPDVLFSGFKSNLPSLVAVGGLYLAGTILVLLLVSLVDDGSLFALMRGEDIEEQMRGDSTLGFTLLVALVLSTPVMMAYWFAPVLAAWSNLPAAKSLFFSYVACLRNWRAFLVYFAALMASGTLFVALAVALLGSLFPSSEEVLAVVLSSLVIIVLVPTLYASFYASYRDIFVVIDENA